MKRSTQIVVGKVLLAGAAFAGATGCSSEPEYTEVQSDHQEICVDQQTQVRVADHLCDDGDGHGGRYHHWYQSRAHGPAPAVGKQINPAWGSSARPAGSISRPPASGGFGTTRVTSGGS